MNTLLATLVYCAGIAVIFYLDRDEKVRTSKALWIPVIWLLINGSRPVSLWFQGGPTEGTEFTDGSPVDAAVYGAVILAGLIALSRRMSRVWSFLKSNRALVIFFSYCLVSTMWSDEPFVSFKRWIKAAGDVIMIVIVLTDADQRDAIKRFLCRAAYVLIPLSILFIKYYPDWGRSYNPWTWEPMYSGVTTFKNLLGMTTLVGALGTLWCFIRSWRELRGRRRWQHLVAEGIILCMSIWLFLTADSMTSFSCFMLAGMVMLIASLKFVARRPWIIHVAVVAAISVALVALFFDTSGDMVKKLGRNSTLTGRTAIWQEVVEQAKHSPILGTGYEGFWMGDRLAAVWRVEKGIQEAHNGYLEVYANLGWVGIGLLAWLIVSGYITVLAIYSRDHTIGVIKLGFFVAALIYSFTEAGFRMMSPIWLGFLLAVMWVPPRQSRPSEAPTPAKKKVRQEERYPTFATTYQGGL